MLESRILQRVRIPSNGVEPVIKNDESPHTPRPLGLMDLPIDIFNQILETLDCIAKQETKEIYDKKCKSTVEIKGPGDQRRYKTYLHQNSPILNSFQIFAVTSRNIYQHCQPRLWRNLRFPSSLPAPIDLWTNDILIRQGSHVQSLSLKLSENCSKPPGEFTEHHPSYDNLSFQNYMGAVNACVSPKNVKDLIDSCPNLSSMNIEYYYFEEPEDKGRTEAFMLTLIPSLSNLKNLRHLKLIDGHLQTCMKEFPSKLVSNLPLLESLAFMGLGGFGDDGKIGDDSFGFHLSKLKYLSRLYLSHIRDLNESWCRYEWPSTITDLAIDRCGHFSPISAYRIIHSMAPKVRKLVLRLVERNDDGCWRIDPIGDQQCRFSLPCLIDLELSTKNPNSLKSFQDCHSMKNLQWDCRTTAHCQSLNHILLQAPWPHFKKLIVVDDISRLISKSNRLEPQACGSLIDSLMKYCEEVDIKANILRGGDVPMMYIQRRREIW